MGQVILTAQMRAKLHGLREKQELRDEQENLIGYFEPAPTPAEPPPSRWWPFMDEEVEAAGNDPGPARTLDEILKDAGLE